MSRRLRIAIYGERFPPIGGGGISAAHYQLYKLLRQDHDVRLFAFVDQLESPTDDIFAEQGSQVLGALLEFGLVRFIRRYDSGRISCCRKIARAIPNIRALNRHLHKFDPDVIIVSDDRLPALGLRPPKRSKLIWVAHHNYQRFRNQRFLNTSCDYDLFLAHRLERRAVRKCHHAVFVSEYMERVFRETLHRDMPGTLIPNYFPAIPATIASKRIQTQAEMGFREGELLIFIPSGGTPIKGSRFVPELVRRLNAGTSRSIGFCITGPVDSLLEYELQQSCLGIKIFRPGPVAHEENLRYASACDLCLSPTLIENFSCALLECQSLGLPCVTFDIGGNTEIVRHDVTGLVVPYLNIDQLLESSLALLNDDSLRLRMQRASANHVSSICNPEVIRTKYNTLFSDLVSCGKPCAA